VAKEVTTRGWSAELSRLVDDHSASLKAVAWAFVFSRLFFEEVAGLAYVYLPHGWVEYPAGVLGAPTSLIYRALIRLWSHWDGQWYLLIAREGYKTVQSTAFFPLYPFLVHVLGGSTTIGGLAISWCAMGIAVWMLFKLVQQEFGERVAWFSVLALLFFPTSFYTEAVYSEAVFLALAISSLYYVRMGRYGWAGLLAGMATLDGIYGLFLAVPLAWTIYREYGFTWRRWLPVLLVPCGLLVYMAYLTPHFLDPLVFKSAQQYWSRGSAEFFGLTLWQGLVSAYQTAGQALSPTILFQTGQPSQTIMNFYNFGFAVYALIIFLLTLRWLPTYLWLYEGLALLLPLTYPAVGQPFMSMPRLVLEAFPVFIGTGVLLERHPRLRAPYFAVSLFLGALLVSLFATSHWVA
jgi:hypothetical protein